MVDLNGVSKVMLLIDYDLALRLLLLPIRVTLRMVLSMASLS